MPIDESLPFKPVRIAILTISDSRSATEDRSGDKLEDLLTGAGHILAARAIIRDEADLIVSRLHNWIDDPEVDVVLTTGATCLPGRHVPPAALRPLHAQDLPGSGSRFRLITHPTITPATQPPHHYPLVPPGP